MGRIPASGLTREKLKTLMEGTSAGGELGSELVRLAARLILEEALEGEAEDALGRGYYMRGALPGAGYRNGYRTGRLKMAEGAVEYSAPQIADRAEPFRSKIRAILGGRTEELEALAVEMYDPPGTCGDGMKDKAGFDYIIVGAGSAGCVLAKP